jgi:hypothetical protein
VNHTTSPPGLLAKLSHQLKTGNLKESSTSKKKHIAKIKLKHYEIDWLNPEVISSECIKYLKKNKSLSSTHESQLFFLMNKFEPGEIKLSFSNAIGKMGHTASKLFYPLPRRKEKIESKFIQLILSIMIYSIRKTVMQVLISSTLNSHLEYTDMNHLIYFFSLFNIVIVFPKQVSLNIYLF